MTAFGPQSPNYSTVRPANDVDVETGLNTWFVDCSAAGANDGTVVTASWLNIMTANLREAVTLNGIALDNANDNMLYEAINAAVGNWFAANVTASGGLQWTGFDVNSTLGAGIRTQLGAGAVDTVNDMFWVYDVDAADHRETNFYNAVAAVFAPSTDATFDAINGTITIAGGGTLTVAAAPPAAPNLRDQWYDTVNDLLYMRTNDGVTDIWIDITT